MLVYGKYECFVMQMLYVCVHPVAVLNAEFCMTCSLLMLVNDARSILQSRSHDLFCFPHLVAVSASIICSNLYACTEML